MEDKIMREQMEELLNGLTDEQKERARACKDMNELTALLGEMGVALPDEYMEEIVAGMFVYPLQVLPDWYYNRPEEDRD